MKRLLACSIALLLAANAAQKSESQESVFADLQKMSADVEEITGMQFSKKVRSTLAPMKLDPEKSDP